jgi:hypothetical protein
LFAAGVDVQETAATTARAAAASQTRMNSPEAMRRQGRKDR